MQIIVLHSRRSTQSVTLGKRHLAIMLLAVLMMIAASTASLVYLTIHYAAELRLPFMENLVAAAAKVDTNRQDRYVRENLNAMAIKLGEMQAQLMRLDALGERVQGLAGIKPEEFNFREKPGRGGLEFSDSADMAGRSPRDLSMQEFQAALDALVTDVGYRSDYLNVVETALMAEKIRSKMLPTIRPVNASYNASGFGWRVDPFNGRQAFHEGIDFAAPTGTPIMAAAGGVVIAAEYHPAFGNMLEIDHGNDIVTRYAHASKLRAGIGDVVRRGQHVADIGSTGRSTGAHLHFEVLVRGVQQNPHKFLTTSNAEQRIAGKPVSAP